MRCVRVVATITRHPPPQSTHFCLTHDRRILYCRKVFNFEHTAVEFGNRYREGQLEVKKATLALDLGTTTGWACNPATGVILSGTWDCAPKKGETEGERYRRFVWALHRFGADHLGCPTKLDRPEPELQVFYEDVRRHLGTNAAHVYGGMLAALKMWCLEKQLSEPVGVGVGQIKKFWTGKGNATKKEMMDEAVLRHFDPADDNEADALALLHKIIVEGPPVVKAKTRKRKTKTAPARQTRRPLARRAAGRLRASHGGVSQKSQRQLGSADKVAEPA